MPKLARIPLLVLFLLTMPAALAAQEVQLPWDDAGRVEVLEHRLAQRLGLFTADHPGFQQARLFQLPDGSFLLELTLLREGRTMRQRIPLSRSDAEALRAEVQGLLAQRAPGAGVDHDGRMTLLFTTTAVGVGYYGWALPAALGVDSYHDAAAFTSLYMLVAGGSFFLPWMATAGQPVSWGMQQAATYGMTRGIAHGWALHALLFGPAPATGWPDHAYPPPGGDEWVYGPHPGVHDEREAHFRRGTAFSLAASVAEGVAGYAWARGRQIDGGHAAALGLGGDAGLLGGFFTGLLLRADERGHGALVTAGSAAGLVGGHLLGTRRQHTMGDVGLLYTTGTLGLQLAVTLMLLADSQDDAALGGLLLAGGATGLLVGGGLVRETNFTVSQSSLIGLGALAGGFAGLGLGALAGGEEAPARLMAALGMAGSVAGFIPLYARYAAEARHQPFMRGPEPALSLSPSLVPDLTGGEPVLRPSLTLRATF